ncbi:MAG: hypothetical protein AMJ46_11475 [Latescibacteria bacterium DG_63]|nr:MAG: hypothetical protein AMJ46_11475 [Latescibacteria bacterium DG_63]
MKRNLVILAIVVLVIINISALATIIHNRWFGVPRPPVEPRHMHPVTFLREHLKLDESQIAEFQARRSSFESEIERVREDMEQKREALMEELRAESPDTLRIDQLVEEIGALQAQLQKRAIRHMLQEQSILTPEQREKFFSMFAKHLHKRGQMPWRSPEGRRGPRSRPFGSERRGRQESPSTDPGVNDADTGGRQ